jgi:hypothetical protein
MIKKFDQFLNEWLDSPGSVDVPGDSYDPKVNSRNYKPANPPLPEIVDAMFETAYINDFLDNQGKSEEFNKFLDEAKRSGSDITGYLKGNFEKTSSKKKNN